MSPFVICQYSVMGRSTQHRREPAAVQRWQNSSTQFAVRTMVLDEGVGRMGWGWGWGWGWAIRSSVKSFHSDRWTKNWFPPSYWPASMLWRVCFRFAFPGGYTWQLQTLVNSPSGCVRSLLQIVRVAADLGTNQSQQNRGDCLFNRTERWRKRNAGWGVGDNIKMTTLPNNDHEISYRTRFMQLYKSYDTIDDAPRIFPPPSLGHEEWCTCN